MSQLRLASINIERSKHLQRVETFLKQQRPDVLCLQELCERDIPFFEELMGNHLIYAPMSRHPAETEDQMQVIGTAIVSRHPLEDAHKHYYRGNPATIPTIAFEDGVEDETGNVQKKVVRGSLNCSLMAATVNGFCIATTHLTVTMNGESTPEQLADADALLAYAREEAEEHGGLLMCGDFNAPRGKPTFSKIAAEFIDGVPAHYTTSIDGNLHRAGPIPFMVDGLFHTPNYKLEGATLHTGVSDHCALTATLSRV